MSEPKLFQHAQGKLAYHEFGSGSEVLVLLHGGGPGAGGLSNYRRNVDTLGAEYRLIVPDFPGFGDSDPIDMSGGVFASFAGVIVELLDHLGIAKAHYVGNSLGGAVSLKTALDHGDRVDKLILMGAAGGKQILTPALSEGLKHLFGYYRGPGPSLEKLRVFLSTMVHDVTALTPELIEERYRVSTDPRQIAHNPFGQDPMPVIEELWREPLARVTHKTLMIWGRDDRTIPLDSALIYLAQLPDAELHVFSNCGHWAQWEKAPEFNRLVSEFLTR
ncbi:alpha/beta fold hydrolase [Sphingoaurantiacus capsulatus]|uniref:Alpha/beta fold hydrolase n=1 Tax=Sphingoaurantiacus capsulatus TaxID=1771310 RepID=A0ABV7XB34_9SPHN